jgi:hypothetical protein
MSDMWLLMFFIMSKEHVRWNIAEESFAGCVAMCHKGCKM